jgi:ABC-type branched-subunit amino acid transport system substrate-binding protein
MKAGIQCSDYFQCIWVFCNQVYLFVSAVTTVVSGSVWAADRTEIRIAASLPVTGIPAGGTLEQKWAYEQAVADINKKGGIYHEYKGTSLGDLNYIKETCTAIHLLR